MLPCRSRMSRPSKVIPDSEFAAFALGPRERPGRTRRDVAGVSPLLRCARCGVLFSPGTRAHPAFRTPKSASALPPSSQAPQTPGSARRAGSRGCRAAARLLPQDQSPRAGHVARLPRSAMPAPGLRQDQESLPGPVSVLPTWNSVDLGSRSEAKVIIPIMQRPLLESGIGAM